MWSPKNARGRKGPHANVAPVAFRAASGDLLGNYTPKVAVFALPTDATDTKGAFEGETASIVASFDFPPENPRVKANTRTLGHLGCSPHLQGDTFGAS